MARAILFYESYLDAVENFPEEYQLEMLKAILKYALRGEEPKDSGFAAGALAFVKPTIDKNSKLKANAEKGGEANKARYEAKDEPTESQAEANVEPTESQAEAKGEPKGSQRGAKGEPKGSQAGANLLIKDKGQGIKDFSPPISPSRGSRFVKPTLDEVRDYVFEKGYHFSAEAFLAFYESNGWKVGKNPMRDWKGACTTWEERRKEDARSGTTKKRNERPEDKHDYDFDSIETMLLQHQAGAG